VATTKRIQNDFAQAGSDVMDKMRDAGCAAQEMAAHGYETIRDTASEYLDQGRAKARAMSDDLHERIREQPTKALVVALGLGFLVGALWRRR
jgi:ElaB/YqjD/DUF883 family membrane-anchored ribosome-binding protein